MDSTTIFTWIWISIGVIVFFYLTFVLAAPYGRHIKKGWGPMVNNKIGWIIMEIPTIVLFSLIYLNKKTFTNQVVFIFLVLWFLHYVYRTFIFPFLIRTKGKKMPLLIALFGMTFQGVNTYLIASYLAENGSDYTTEWFISWQFIVGIIIFLVGFVIHTYSDYILINLREIGETGYKIPHGFMFKYLTSPNYFGEILQWGGFALMTWCLPSLAFFVWTLANLVPRALANHKWYIKTFENYPKDRKRIIPKIY